MSTKLEQPRRINGTFDTVKKISCTCPNCSTLFELYPSDVERGRRYCSYPCAMEGARNKAFRIGAPRTRVLVTCEVCPTQFEVVPARLAKGGGRYCSNKCYGQTLINPNKNQTEVFYSSCEWTRTRKAVYKRDNYICQDCSNGREVGRRVAHHIVRLEDCDNPLDMNNLVTLCVSCHNIRHDKFGAATLRKS